MTNLKFTRNTTARPYRTAAKIERAKMLRRIDNYWIDVEVFFEEACCGGVWPRPWSVLPQANPWLDGGIGVADND